ncbi:hypothetical protein QQF64_017368 [Cirrhinus molitorella]|uniref:Uncharacterized protein n=1 Tax=Cirrhinus molitorella TaxID=172907 RepID=A0ABR3LJU1_9TELE
MAALPESAPVTFALPEPGQDTANLPGSRPPVPPWRPPASSAPLWWASAPLWSMPPPWLPALPVLPQSPGSLPPNGPGPL